MVPLKVRVFVHKNGICLQFGLLLSGIDWTVAQAEVYKKQIKFNYYNG